MAEALEPPGLSAALRARRAEVRSVSRAGKRSYLLARSPNGPLFARYSSDPADAEIFDHEAAVRALVGASGVLRSPPVLDRGPGWLLEHAVEAQPLRGPEAVEVAVAAVERLMSLDLPDAPVRGGAAPALRRRLRIVASPIPKRDLVAARRALRGSHLPPATGHGDFYSGNVLFADAAAWVVDWELAGRWPAGYDLMRLWSTLERPDDRELLFERTVALLGEANRSELARLRYAVLVYTIAGLFGAERRVEEETAWGRELLQLLPDVRAAAGT